AGPRGGSPQARIGGGGFGGLAVFIPRRLSRAGRWGGGFVSVGGPTRRLGRRGGAPRHHHDDKARPCPACGARGSHGSSLLSRVLRPGGIAPAEAWRPPPRPLLTYGGKNDVG